MMDYTETNKNDDFWEFDCFLEGEIWLQEEGEVRVIQYSPGGEILENHLFIPAKHTLRYVVYIIHIRKVTLLHCMNL